MITPITADGVNTVSHLIQLSVAPVFLLAAVAGLLNVFTGRLARIIDKVEKIDASVENKKTEEARHVAHEKTKERRLSLTMRMQNINYSISLCTMTGLLIALVIVTMFLSSIFQFDGSIFIATLFIFAMLSLITSLLLFQKEIFYTTSFIKKKKASLKK
jgi:Flp pilus assembly protein TadB